MKHIYSSPIIEEIKVQCEGGFAFSDTESGEIDSMDTQTHYIELWS